MRSEGNTPENGEPTVSWFLLHDIAPIHQSVSANDFLAKNNMTQLNLASADVCLPELKFVLKGRRICICDVGDVIKNATKELNGFHKMASRNVF
jgi:hypothetical protein